MVKDLYAKLTEDEGCNPWMDDKGLEYGDSLAEGIFPVIKQCNAIMPMHHDWWL